MNDEILDHHSSVSKNFSNLFNAYSKAINKGFNRTGSLFEKPFHRIPVTQDSHLLDLIFYIHFNPQKHGLVSDFRSWRWSSYKTLCQSGNTRLNRDEIIGWFGSKHAFMKFHEEDLVGYKLTNNYDDF